MFRFLGAFVLSLMISNWIYSEFLLFVPQAGPVISRTMTYLSIPTHNEWSGIVNAPGAADLGDELRSLMSNSPLNQVFSASGISDPAVQRVLKGQSSGSSSQRASTVASESIKPFQTGSSIFLEASEAVQSFGGYERFLF